MKVGGSGNVTSSGLGAGARTGRAGGAFSLPSLGGTAPAQHASPTSGVAGVAGLDALLALQETGGPLERRRKAVGRAGRILDVLDEIKVSLLDDRLTTASMDRLVRAVRDERAATEDPGLEGVLNEIELRAAVELAKLQRAKIAA